MVWQGNKAPTSNDRRGVDNKFFCLGIPNCSSLHLDSVIAIPEFGQGEAANDRHVVYAVQILAMTIRAKLENGTPKQVVLHGHLGSKRGIEHSSQLVSWTNVANVNH